MLKDDWIWQQDTEGTLLQLGPKPDDQAGMTVVMQGDANGWARIVDIRLTTIPAEVALLAVNPTTGKIPNSPTTRHQCEQLPAITEDEAIARVRAAFAQLRDWEATRALLALVRDDVEPDAVRATFGTRLAHSSTKDDAHLTRVATAYEFLTGQGRHNPAPLMADVFHVAPQTVRGWLVECRKRGLLPPAQPGKAGTTPAAKATTPTRKPAAKNTTKNGGKK